MTQPDPTETTRDLLWRHQLPEAALRAVETAMDDTLLPTAREKALAALAAVLPAPTDQTALERAADVAETVAMRLRDEHDIGGATGAYEVMTELRRLAGEAPQDLCGRAESVDGSEYPPCARSAGHCEAYCRSADGQAYFLARLGPRPARVARQDPAPVYPRPDGDVTVLGPEVFASADGDVICWRGENYVRAERTAVLRITHVDQDARQDPAPDGTETGSALASYITEQPISVVQAALRILGWPLRFDLMDDDTAVARSGQPEEPTP